MKFLFFKLNIYISLLILCIGDLEAKSAHEYVETVHENIIQVIKTEQENFSNKPEKFVDSISDALAPIVDFKMISRSVMGKYYKNTTTEQRQNFAKVFETTLLNSYSKTLAEFRDEEIVVLPETKKSMKKGRARVNLQIITNTKIYEGSYSMYLDANMEWKIINIIINGVNLGRTLRNQFDSLMIANSNNIDKVIETWSFST